jgi:hypothetical protein
MAGIKAICESSDHKAVIYQWLGQQGRLYDGADHPYGQSMMNEYAFNMLKPLLESQAYIQSFEKWGGEKVMVDLDRLRQVKNHMPYGNIVTWMAFVFAEMRPRYWEPWITIEGKVSTLKNRIVINRTSRYRAPWIDYFHLKKYEDQITFVGLPDEWESFNKEWGLNVPMWDVSNFYELAVVLNSCKLFIGNQSMCFAIAEAMKVPRLLEVCDFAPNVQPCGEGGYYFREPHTFEYLVEKLMT